MLLNVFCSYVGVGKVLPAKPSKVYYKPLYEWTCQRREDVRQLLDASYPIETVAPTKLLIF